MVLIAPDELILHAWTVSLPTGFKQRNWLLSAADSVV
jgi:hypothetical protein